MPKKLDKQSTTGVLKSECKYCLRETTEYGKKIMCPEVSMQGNLCTRPTGHDGQHVACGTLAHEYEKWD